MDLVAEMHAVASALDAAGVRYAVCGGVAVTAHGAPRSTDDLDIIVAPDDVSRVLEAVRPIGYTFAALPRRFDEGTPKERVVEGALRVVSRPTLERMKRFAGRPKDLADLEALGQVDDS